MSTTTSREIARTIAFNAVNGDFDNGTAIEALVDLARAVDVLEHNWHMIGEQEARTTVANCISEVRRLIPDI